MDPALQELRDQFFRILDEGGPEQDVAHKVWVLFIEHPWFQAELKRAERRVLWHVGAHLKWAADIEQEVVVMLREKLSRKPNLGVNRAKAERQFSGWLATIIERTCRDAVRAMLVRETRIVADVRLIAAAQAKPTHLADTLDLAEAIGSLPRRCQIVVFLQAQKFSVRQIARILKTSKSDIGRLLQEAQRLLPTRPGS
jgi:DNA-directed RNA polymerase specialized sigma24 family protein